MLKRLRRGDHSENFNIFLRYFLAFEGGGGGGGGGGGCDNRR